MLELTLVFGISIGSAFYSQRKKTVYNSLSIVDLTFRNSDVGIEGRTPVANRKGNVVTRLHMCNILVNYVRLI